MRNTIRLSAVLYFALLFGACHPMEPPLAKNVSIARVKELGGNYPERITRAWYINGRVTSSDLDGNFYKKVVIEDATGAIELNVDSRKLFLSAPWCSLVKIFIEGLWVGSYGRSFVLGAEPQGYFPVENISNQDFERRVQIISTSDSTYRPTTRMFSDLTLRDNQRWIRFDSVQFAAEELSLSWGCADSTARRHIVTPTADTLRVVTSAYASWANCLVPSGSGAIDGILYYRRDGWELWPTSIVRVRMDSPRFEVR